jgi:dihydroneopterin aldolase
VARHPDDPEDDLFGDEELDPDEDAEDLEPVVTVEISGLSVFTHHGVEEAEREVGQRLVFDVSFAVGASDATVTDRVEDTVDYADAAQQVLLVAQERSYRTLERLCSVVADRMIERYGAEAVTVRAAKPEPPMPVSVDEVAVEVHRERA